MSDERIQHQQRFEPEVYAWLKAESEASGRSITWLVEHAVVMWLKRLNRQREVRAEKAVSPR